MELAGATLSHISVRLPQNLTDSPGLGKALTATTGSHQISKLVTTEPHFSAIIHSSQVDTSHSASSPLNSVNSGLNSSLV